MSRAGLGGQSITRPLNCGVEEQLCKVADSVRRPMLCTTPSKNSMAESLKAKISTCFVMLRASKSYKVQSQTVWS